MKKFLVGVTTTEASADVLALARMLARDQGAAIVVGTVISKT